MITREQIIEEIKRIANKLGVSNLDQQDFELNSMIPMSTVRYYLGSWQQAILEAGLGSVVKPGPQVKMAPGNESQLLLELLRLHEETGEIPSRALIEAKGKYSARHYLERWKSISEAFLLAQKKFPPPAISFQATPKTESYHGAPLVEPAEIFFQSKEVPVTQPHIGDLPGEITESLRVLTESLEPHADIPIETLDSIDDHLFLEKPFSFRGLVNPPVNRSGVIFLFGFIHRELGYTISNLLPGHPDCKGERCVDFPDNCWEPIHIHFEYKSSDFQVQGRTAGVKDILVCWQHDCQSGSWEVLELSTAIKQLPAR